MTHILGNKPGNVIVPYASATKRTKKITPSFSTTPAGWSLTSAWAYAYADSSDNWWLTFFIYAGITPDTSAAVTMDGVTFVSGYNQPLAGFSNSAANGTRYYVGNGDGRVSMDRESSATDFFCTGTALLASKPTWADANMEGVVAADVYIPFGQTGMPGEVISATLSDTSLTTTNNTYSDITGASLPLTPGKWLIQSGVHMNAQGLGGSAGWFDLVLRLTDSVPTTIFEQHGEMCRFDRVSSGSQVCINYPLIVTSNTTYKLRGGPQGQSGNANCTYLSAIGGYFFAVRLAP
jgi:hypothetical protein